MYVFWPVRPWTAATIKSIQNAAIKRATHRIHTHWLNANSKHVLLLLLLQLQTTHVCMLLTLHVVVGIVGNLQTAMHHGMCRLGRRVCRPHFASARSRGRIARPQSIIIKAIGEAQ